jgi:hypothetical protein
LQELAYYVLEIVFLAMALGFLLVEVKEFLVYYITNRSLITFGGALRQYLVSDWNSVDLFNIAILIVSIRFLPPGWVNEVFFMEFFFLQLLILFCFLHFVLL